MSRKATRQQVINKLEEEEDDTCGEAENEEGVEAEEDDEKKTTSNRYCNSTNFLLISRLNKLDPKTISAVMLNEIILIFCSIDVNLYIRVIDWLEPSLGFTESSRIVLQAFNKLPTPLVFKLDREYGWIIACRKLKKKIKENKDGNKPSALFFPPNSLYGVGTFSNDESAKGEEEESEEDDNDDEAKLVPATSVDGLISGRISATVREGDIIKLKSASSRLYVIEQMKQQTGSILLKEFSPESATNARKNLVEFCEIRPSHLLGAFIMREGAILTKSESARKELLGFNFDTLVVTVNNEETASKAEKDGLTWRRLEVVFRLPGPDEKVSLARLSDIVKQQQKITSFTNSSKRQEGSIQQMQHLAQVRVWVKRKEEVARARLLLSNADPFVCVLQREKWLLVCRALRVISKGGYELFGDFCRWTKSAGSDGYLRARDCRAAWDALRPSTSVTFIYYLLVDLFLSNFLILLPTSRKV